MSRLDRVVRELGYLAAMEPADELRRRKVVADVVDLAGGINRTAMLPHLPADRLRWGPGDTGRVPTVQSGRAVMLRAAAETPPSTGNATITLTTLTEFAGVQTIGTLAIPKGQQFGAEALDVELPAGTWVGATVTTANGASGVSIALTVEME